MSFKVQSIAIKNFRSIDFIVLDKLTTANVFIGKNNAGKSNILRALSQNLTALINGYAFSKEIFSTDDIRENDIIIKSVISIDGELHLGVVSSLIYSGEIYTISLMVKLNESIELSSEFNVYDDEINSYKKLIRDFIKHIKTIERQNVKRVDFLGDLEKIRNNEERIPPTHVYEFIENNLNLSRSAMTSIRSGKFTTVDANKELYEKVDNFLNMANHSIDQAEKIILKVGGEMADFWKKHLNNRGSIRLKVQNGNFLIPYYWGIKSLYKTEKNEPINQNDVESLFQIKNKKETLHIWYRIKGIIQKVIGIEIDIFLNDNNIPTLDIDKNWFNLNGSGIREILRMILDIEISGANQILIEEPEVYLHYELERKFSDYLLSLGDDHQVFITTHSTAFVDNSQNRSTFMIRRRIEDNLFISDVYSVSDDKLIDAAKELGINVHALLMRNSLVYVEGTTDEMILQKYLKKFHSEISFSIGFVDMKSESQYDHYATATSMGIFDESGLKTFFILDSDNKTVEQKESRQSQHPKGSKLFFWSGKCIENLFLTKEILHKFISSKTRKDEILLEEVENAMDKTFDELKYISFKKYVGEKYLRPILPGRSKGKQEFSNLDKVKEWYIEKKQFMEEQVRNLIDIDNIFAKFETEWNGNKVGLTPGDLFLKEFCKQFGDYTYDKKKNSINHLTDRLSKTEWPQELQEVMDSIVAEVTKRPD